MRQWGKRPEQLAPLVIARVRQAALVAELAAEGLSPGEIQKHTGMNRWALERHIMPLARRLGRGRLANMLRLCAACDRALKSSPLDPDLLFGQLLIDLCKRQEPAEL
jgi:DNA polymerase III delta subunit